MALFRTDLLALCYSDVEIAARWWMAMFDCKRVRVPESWDDTLPSDVALTLPGHSAPTILLSDKSQIQRAGFTRGDDHPLLFSDRLEKARAHLLARGLQPTFIQAERGTEFFELVDLEGNAIEVCKEP